MDLASIIVGAVVGIAGILVALAIARWQQHRISVDVFLDSDVALIKFRGTAESFADGIEVTYDGRLVRSPRIIDAQVKNTGNRPVQAADYEEPIVLELQGGIAPIEATVIGASVDGIAGELFEEQPNGTRAIRIRPSLMNRGDWFRVRMLFNDQESQFVGSHRIVGGKPMRVYRPNFEGVRARFTSIILGVVFAAWLGGGIVGVVQTNSPAAALVTASAAGGIAALAVAMLIALAAIVFRLDDARKERNADS